MATKKADTETVERVVKAQFFRYTVLVPIPGDADGKVRPVMKTALRGETVDVLKAEAEKADMYGAFHPDSAVSVDEDGDAVVEADLTEMTDAELAAWVKEDRPKEADLVDLAEGDSAKAERLLNAERAATGGKPRKGVNASLTKIIDDNAAGGSGQVPVQADGTP